MATLKHPTGPGSTGDPHAGRAPATLQDVAREAGVSTATASRVLNGSARSVRRENAARVHAATDKLGYRPHLSAQATARGSTRTAALVVADPYFSTIASGVIQASETAGLIVTMAATVGSPERELDIVRALRGHRPDVIIVAGSRIDSAETRDALVEELDAYQTGGGRAVLISQAGLPFPTVVIDNYGGARQLAGALVDNGYRRAAGSDRPRRTVRRRSRVQPCRRIRRRQ